MRYHCRIPFARASQLCAAKFRYFGLCSRIPVASLRRHSALTARRFWSAAVPMGEKGRPGSGTPRPVIFSERPCLTNTRSRTWRSARTAKPFSPGAATSNPKRGKRGFGTHPAANPLDRPSRIKATVWALAFSPDGKTILTAGTADLQAGTVEARMWDAASGEPRGQPLPQIGVVSAVAFSPDGKAFASASWNAVASRSEVRLWDAASGKPLGEPHRFAAFVNSVVFSPDGKTIVTGSGDSQLRKGEVRFWDRATGAPIGQPLRHAAMVHSVALSPDGRTLLTGSGDYASRKGETQLWDAATGKLLGAPIPQQGIVRQVAVSPDGRRFSPIAVRITNPALSGNYRRTD